MRSFVRLALAIALSARALTASNLPTHEERAAALGSLAETPEILRRLLSEDSDFDLIPRAQPGDWLAVHPEPGQSFAAFLAGKPNRPDATRRTIYLLPIGAFSSGGELSLETLRRFAAAFFQLEVKILPAYTPKDREFEPRVNPNTKQLQVLTGSILNFLEERVPPDAFCLLGVTWDDLYPAPNWNYVFGQASLRERVGIYSFARYDPDFFGESRPDDFHAVMLRRGCKVLAHETGHMFGLKHCIYFNCVLNGSNSLAETDAQTLQLCPICLRKLQHSTGFDPVSRYQQLAHFYQREKLRPEEMWCERQLAKVNPP